MRSSEVHIHVADVSLVGGYGLPDWHASGSGWLSDGGAGTRTKPISRRFVEVKPIGYHSTRVFAYGFWVFHGRWTLLVDRCRIWDHLVVLSIIRAYCI